MLEGAHGPVAFGAGDLAHEIAQQRGALRRVHDLEMELRGVEFALVVGDQRDRRIRRGADHAKAFRQFRHAVAVAHPDRIFLALLPHALEQRRVLGHRHFGAAEFAVMPALHLAAELMRHRLLAVADAEHRHAGLEDRHRRERRARLEHRGRSAGQDHGLRLHRGEGFLRLLIRHDLGIDLFLAHPPRDQLGHLRAEIDDQNFVVGGAPWRLLNRHARVCRDAPENHGGSRRNILT